jgi:hypothetical protein
MTTLGSIERCGITIQKPIGYWVISEKNYRSVYKKPKWLVRKMTKILLGWEYKDDKSK